MRRQLDEGELTGSELKALLREDFFEHLRPFGSNTPVLLLRKAAKLKADARERLETMLRADT